MTPERSLSVAWPAPAVRGWRWTARARHHAGNGFARGAAMKSLALKAALFAVACLVLAILDFAGVLTGRADSKGVFALIGFVCFAIVAVQIFGASRKADASERSGSSDSEGKPTV